MNSLKVKITESDSISKSEWGIYVDMFQEFKDLLNLLQVDFDALTGELSVLHNESKVAFQEVGKACVEAPRLVQNQVDQLEVESLANQFEAFRTSIKSSPLSAKIPNLEQQIGVLLEKEARLRKTQRQIRKKLRVLEKEIDAWIASGKRKPNRHRLGQAKEAKPIASLERSLDSLDQSFSHIRENMESSRKSLKEIQRNFPEVILALLDAINTWLGAFEDSTKALVSSVKLLTTNELILPTSIDDWRSRFIEALHEREVHLHPNLQLGSSDLNLFSIDLFQTELKQREQAVLIMSREQESVQQLVDIHLPTLGVSHFDMVEFERNKIIDGKSRSLSRFIRERQKTTWDELKPKHQKQWDAADFCAKQGNSKSRSPKDKVNSARINNLLTEYQAKYGQQVDTIVTLQLHEEYNEAIQFRLQSLLEEAPSKVQRHFHEKPFSVLVLASTKIEVKEFVSAYKRSWHLFPNFHLCIDALLTSNLKQRELDEIIKLPISAKLCNACLEGELTTDQALILQSIDVHNELFEFVKSHASVDLSLVFALHAQEGQYWLGALLKNPEMFAEIEQHRHEPFEQSIWDLVIQKKVKLWQYACIVRLEFDDTSAKETLLLADEFWEELNEMAALYDVEDALQELIKVYKPVEDTAKPGAQISLKDVYNTISPSDGASKAGAPISLNDVYNTIKPIAPVTVNTSMAKSKKTKRRKKGRYQI